MDTVTIKRERQFWSGYLCRSINWSTVAKTILFRLRLPYRFDPINKLVQPAYRFDIVKVACDSLLAAAEVKFRSDVDRKFGIQ